MRRDELVSCLLRGTPITVPTNIQVCANPPPVRSHEQETRGCDRHDRSTFRHTRAVAAGESSEPAGGKTELSSTAPEARDFEELGHYVPADILNVSFPHAVRGYDRRAVDAYVTRVSRVIAELKISASPRAAVTHALEQTEQQVSGLLQRARETGEEITESARQEAEEIFADAKAKAADLLVNVSAEADGLKAEAEKLIADARTEAEDILTRSRLEAQNTAAQSEAKAKDDRQQLEDELTEQRGQAEAQLRELQADTEGVRKARGELLDDIHATAAELLELAKAAAIREAGEETTEIVEPASLDDTEPADTRETALDDAGSRARRKQGRPPVS
jgi:DivIVA domain-containing protein